MAQDPEVCPVSLLPEEAHRREDPAGDLSLSSGDWHDSWLPTFLLLPDDQRPAWLSEHLLVLLLWNVTKDRGQSRGATAGWM